MGDFVIILVLFSLVFEMIIISYLKSNKTHNVIRIISLSIIIAPVFPIPFIRLQQPIECYILPYDPRKLKCSNATLLYVRN